jgi:DnaK suppressor protein
MHALVGTGWGKSEYLNMAAKKKAGLKKPGSSRRTARKTARKARPAKPARAGRKPVKAARRAPAPAARKSAAPKKPALRIVGIPTRSAAGTPAAAKPAAATRSPATAKSPAAARPPARDAVLRFQQPAVAREKPRAQPSKDYMNPRQVEVFRKLLLDWKRSLMEEVDRTVHHMQDEASNFPDPNDRATQEEEFALELRTRDRERKLIKKIDDALVSLDAGEYGYCEICGVEIGIKRLEARPTATLCIDCKNLEEIRERQYG